MVLIIFKSELRIVVTETVPYPDVDTFFGLQIEVPGIIQAVVFRIG